MDLHVLFIPSQWVSTGVTHFLALRNHATVNTRAHSCESVVSVCRDVPRVEPRLLKRLLCQSLHF